MISKVIVEQNHHWNRQLEYPKISRADFIYNSMKIDWKTPHIEIISGIRRSGKSTIFQEIISELSKIKPVEKILLINFDHPIFLQYCEKPEQLDDIIRCAEAITGDTFEYLFFDEIQTIHNWEKWVKVLYDSKKYKKIFLTGSNSKLLETDYIARLSGRYMYHLNLPLSFSEVLNHYEIDHHNQRARIHNESKIRNIYEEYIQNGGFPESIIYKQKVNEILKSYYDTIIIKDVVSNNEIRDVYTLKQIAYLCISSITDDISYNRIAKQFGIHHQTVKEYLHALESSYLFFLVSKFDNSIRKQETHVKKIYAIDTGLVNKIAFSFSENKGKYLENIIFLELIRRNKTVYYHRDKYECDFLIHNNQKITHAIQVCYEMKNEKIRTREIRGLEEAMKSYSLDKGYILTHEEEDIMCKNGKIIYIIPAWKWLLERFASTKNATEYLLESPTNAKRLLQSVKRNKKSLEHS